MGKMKAPPASMNVPLILMRVNVFIVDIRAGKRVIHLHAEMKMPSLVREKGQQISWNFPQLRDKTKGVVTDLDEGSVSIVFLFADRINGMKQDGKDASFEELVTLFQWFAPELKIIPETDLSKFYKES